MDFDDTEAMLRELGGGSGSSSSSNSKKPSNVQQAAKKQSAPHDDMDDLLGDLNSSFSQVGNGKSPYKGAELHSMEKEIQKQHGNIEYSITEKDFEEVKKAAKDKKGDWNSLNSLVAKIGEAANTDEPDIAVISKALKDYTQVSGPAPTSFPSSNKPSVQKDWGSIDNSLKNFQQKANTVGYDGDTAQPIAIAQPVKATYTTTTATVTTTSAPSWNTSKAAAPVQTPAPTPVPVSVPKKTTTGPSEANNFVLLDEGRKMIAAVRTLSDAELPEGTAIDLEQYEEKPKVGINKLSMHVSKDASEVDGRIVSGLIVNEIINPLRIDLKLASERNKDKIRNNVNNLVSAAMNLLKVVKSLSNGESNESSSWNSAVDAVKSSGDGLLKAIKEAAADYLVEHL